MSDDARRAYESAALQALASLGHVEATLRREMADLSQILEKAATPDALLADPDSPVNVLATLSATRAEVVAARAALEPFARAYLRKMDQLGDVLIPVFVDPLRPDHSRFVKLSDLKEASRVVHSMSIGAETLAHLRHLEAFTEAATLTLESFAERNADRLCGEDRHALHNLLAMAKALAGQKSL